jgi:hypothetical protein
MGRRNSLPVKNRASPLAALSPIRPPYLGDARSRYCESLERMGRIRQIGGLVERRHVNDVGTASRGKVGLAAFGLANLAEQREFDFPVVLDHGHSMTEADQCVRDHGSGL